MCDFVKQFSQSVTSKIYATIDLALHFMDVVHPPLVSLGVKSPKADYAAID